MGEFVDDRGHQLQLVVPEDCGEERVRKPAQGAEGGGGPQVGIEPLLFELALLVESVAEVEESPVGNPADDRKPPCPGEELVLVRGRQHHRQGVPIELGVGGVAVPNVQFQLVHGEVPGLGRKGELGASLLVGLGLEDDLRDRPAGAEDLGLLPPGLDHIRGRARGARPERCGHDYSRRRGHEQSRPQPPAPAGVAPFRVGTSLPAHAIRPCLPSASGVVMALPPGATGPRPDS